MGESKSKTKESSGVKKYIRYVMRVYKLSKISEDLPDSEALYFRDLYNSLKDYYKTHKLYLSYLIGKINYSAVKNFIGLTEDRQVFRYLEKQRKSLISYILEKEVEFSKKYSLVVENKLEEVRGNEQ